LVERFLGLILKPGIDASTSRIVAGLGLAQFDVPLNSLSTKEKHGTAQAQLIYMQAIKNDRSTTSPHWKIYWPGMCMHASQGSHLTWQQNCCN
jgi:hypothetical protein